MGRREELPRGGLSRIPDGIEFSSEQFGRTGSSDGAGLSCVDRDSLHFCSFMVDNEHGLLKSERAACGGPEKAKAAY